MQTIEQLENDIQEIKTRNLRVEADKAWETSATRRCAILALTYVVMVVFFVVIKQERPFIGALVPVLAFALSTLTLSFFKKYWMRKVYRK